MSKVAVEGLWKSYGDRSILERIKLEVLSGSFITLVGASGCGKSTFLRLLLGQERPSRGRILIDDQPLVAEPGLDRGVVFQRYSVYPHLNVIDNVLLGLDFKSSPRRGRLFGKARKRAKEQAFQLITEMGLGHVAEALPSALSGGMQQRLAMAQAVILNPKILLLDEPFGALDPGVRKDMHVLTKRLWREHAMTIFMVTHDIKEAFALGTRVLTFDKIRHDTQQPEAYGATITYDLAGKNQRWPADLNAAENNHARSSPVAPDPALSSAP